MQRVLITWRSKGVQSTYSFDVQTSVQWQAAAEALRLASVPDDAEDLEIRCGWFLS